MRIVACTHEGHAESILDILNEAIENSMAIYEYRPRPLSSVRKFISNYHEKKGIMRNSA